MMNLIGFTDLLRDAIKNTDQQVASLSQIEGQIRQSLQELGTLWLSEWLRHCARAYSTSAWQCPQCGELSRYERDREASLQTMLGRVSYKRSVYACHQCGHRHYPMEKTCYSSPN